MSVNYKGYVHSGGVLTNLELKLTTSTHRSHTMNRIIFILTLSAFLFSQQAEVTNIQAAQRTDGSQIVDITYDLLEDNIFEIFVVTVEVSLDGGTNYQTMNNVEGDIGPTVTAGMGKILIKIQMKIRM